MSPRQMVIGVTATVFLVGFCLLALLFLREREPATPEPEEYWMLPRRQGARHAVVLASGSPAGYRVSLRSGEYVHIAVEQHGIDIIATLLGPSGESLLVVDSPTLDRGIEHLHVVAEEEGTYRIHVAPLTQTDLGRFEVAIDSLRPATARDRVRARAARVYSNAEHLRRTGSVHEALQEYKRALALWTEAGDSYQRGLTLRRMGRIWYRLGSSHDELACNRQAFEVFRSLGERQQEATLLNDLGRGYRFLGRARDATVCYSQAIEVARGCGFLQAEAVALHNLGMLSYHQRDLQGALLRFHDALEVSRRAGDTEQQAVTLECIAATYCLAGKLVAARDQLDQALVLRKAAGDRTGQADTLTELGWVCHCQGEPAEAIACLTRALALWQEVGDSFGEAVTFDRLGTIYREQGDAEAALDPYLNALKVFRNGYRLEEAHTLANLAALYLALGKHRTALEHCRDAEQRFRQLDELSGEAGVLLTRAKIQRAVGDLGRAKAEMERAVSTLDRLRCRPYSPSLKASFFSTKHEYYELSIDLLMEMHRRAPNHGYDGRALEILERERARSLLESLAEARAKVRQSLDESLLTREQELQAQLNRVIRQRERLEARQASAEILNPVDRELRTLVAAFERFEAEIRASSPRYAALTCPEPQQLRQIQGMLDEDTLLLAYSLGEEQSFLWAVSKHCLGSHRLPPRRSIEREALKTLDVLARSWQTAARSQAELLVSRLGKTLLAPVVEELGSKRLLVVGDGMLAFIPFGALPDPRIDAAGSAEPIPVLLANHEVIMLPSISVIHEQRRRTNEREHASMEIAVFADPVFSPEDDRVQQSAAEASHHPTHLVRTDLVRLPFSAQEAAAIKHLVPASHRQVFQSFAASRDNVLHSDLGRFRVVHFSTHGLLHNEFPRLSGIALSMVDRLGRPQDGNLRSHEICTMDLPVELVVVSACKTALGQEVRGEGVLNLSRSFMFAGAARVVVSLWDVQDLATAELMERFYRGIFEENRRPADALRAAQISMLHESRWEAPYYWAAFVFQGEWR